MWPEHPTNENTFLSNQDLISIRQWLFEMDRYKFQKSKEFFRDAKKILGLKYKVLGYGVFRIVFNLDNGYVLKVPMRPSGLLSNKVEFDLYRKSPEFLRKHLCPVEEFGYGWIIMKKINRQISIGDNDFKIQVSKLKKDFLEYGIDAQDLKEDNLALSSDGKVIVIDYGNFERISWI